ncbi:MAG: hypothetical protein AAGA35_02410 [Patescibacteria group bacterium]
MIAVLQASRYPISLALVALLLLNALPSVAHSQSEQAETTEVSEELVEEADIAGQANETVIEDVATNNDWFRVERLVGNNIQVGDFVIGPGKVELEIQPGETVVREVSVSNRISDGREFILEVEDISGTADGSQAVVLLGDDRGPYSLKDLISFPSNTFEIGLGERARIPVTITVPPDAEPGGYYGSVIVSTVRKGERPSEEGVARSPIIARIGSLFFVTVPGAVETAAQLQDFKTTDGRLWYESGPINFGLTYENTGTRHLNPYGEIRISNMLGEEVGFVELDPWFALPQSVRLRELSWDRELLLGRYTAVAQINRGYEDIVDEMTISFWVLPWKIIAGVFGGLFIIFFLIRAFFRTFEFKRKGT